MKNGKDELISQSMEQVDNYKVRPESFPMKGVKPVGMAEGKDKLSDAPDCPRTLEDSGWGPSGAGTPSVWGKGGTHFKVETNKGESEEGSPSKVTAPRSVNFETGQIEPNPFSSPWRG